LCGGCEESVSGEENDVFMFPFWNERNLLKILPYIHKYVRVRRKRTVEQGFEERRKPTDGYLFFKHDADPEWEPKTTPARATHLRLILREQKIFPAMRGSHMVYVGTANRNSSIDSV